MSFMRKTKNTMNIYVLFMKLNLFYVENLIKPITATRVKVVTVEYKILPFFSL